ncbi:unnamed protein product, partial [Protopolystoma xenopodis]
MIRKMDATEDRNGTVGLCKYILYTPSFKPDSTEQNFMHTKLVGKAVRVSSIAGGSKGFVAWPHRKPQESGCRGLLSVELFEEKFGSPSYDPDDSVPSLRLSRR